jgi:hypothetical protein
VGGVLDPLVAIEAAATARDLVLALEETDRGLGGGEGERAADRCGRDRVVVEVE